LIEVANSEFWFQLFDSCITWIFFCFSSGKFDFLFVSKIVLWQSYSQSFCPRKRSSYLYFFKYSKKNIS